MNGAHDMGGAMGFGPVVAEKNEPVFHFEWEGRVRAMTMAMGAPMGSNLARGRFARERIDRLRTICPRHTTSCGLPDLCECCSIAALL